MNTAVQLRPAVGNGPGAARSEIIHGAPEALREGRFGPIALFPGDSLVAYLVRHRRRQSLFVFRTLGADDRLAARLPGVRPGVRLLVSVRSRGRARLLQQLFRYLRAHGPDPAGMSDGFWFRLGAVLGGRLPRHKILLSLLSRGTNSPCTSSPPF
jgi:hypothetical protein